MASSSQEASCPCIITLERWSSTANPEPLTYTVSEGEDLVTRTAEAGTPAPSERLGPGDAALPQPGEEVYEEGVVDVTENLGDEPAVIWIAVLTPADEPLTQFHEATVTP